LLSQIISPNGLNSEAYALPDGEASTCMTALYNNFFSRFGFPRQLHSDQGIISKVNCFKNSVKYPVLIKHAQLFFTPDQMVKLKG